MVEGTPAPERTEPRVFRWLSVLELTIGCLALTAIFAMVILQAAQRYLPGGGWPWTGELARYSLAWLTFIMLGYLTGKGRQITLLVIDGLCSKRALRAVKTFANLAMAATAIGFTLACWELVSVDTGQVSPAMGVPVVWLYVIPLVGFASTALRSIVAVFVPEPDDDPSETDGQTPEVTR